MWIVTATLLLLLAPVALAALPADRPDPSLTPGAINPEVTQANIRDTICIPGWTKTVRPPAHYTNRLKKQQLCQYDLCGSNPHAYKEDHLIPLGLGGHPTDPRNLWPEPDHSRWGAREKDRLEHVLHRRVCAGEIPLQDAQRAIAQDWIEAYKRYVGS